MDMERLVAALVLRTVPGVGDRGYRTLVDALGSPQAVLTASAAVLAEQCGVSERLAAAIGASRRFEAESRQSLQRAVDAGCTLLEYGGPDYPLPLASIADPPSVIYLAGTVEAIHRPCVAVVGSRRASSHGIRFAQRLAEDLVGAGYVVVSGLAQGIDAAAHQGALQAGGATVAVFGSGLNIVYPRRNAELAARLRKDGAWVSEFSVGVAPNRHNFPRRNRMISGLSLGVIVVEASEHSGSLITATCALEQGREVFAVPGLPGAYGSQGTHKLLRQGAKLVEGVGDVTAELGACRRSATGTAGADPAGREADAPREWRHLWQVLEDVPLHIDALATAAGVDAAQMAAGLMELVLSGHAVEWEGNRYTRASGGQCFRPLIR